MDLKKNMPVITKKISCFAKNDNHIFDKKISPFGRNDGRPCKKSEEAGGIAACFLTYQYPVNSHFDRREKSIHYPAKR
jgi:hypothetical protein